MKKIKILGLTALLVIMFSIPCFATTSLELSLRFAAANNEIDAEIEEAEHNLMERTYPVGSIYITTENLTESNVAEKLGTGRWKEMKNTFLWARDTDQILRDDPITGGKSTYNFSALAGQFASDPSQGAAYDEIRLAYLTGFTVPAYMLNKTPSTVIEHEENSNEALDDPDGEGGGDDPEEDPEFSFGSDIKVTEEGERDIEIMPPYMVVKMFKRIS